MMRRLSLILLPVVVCWARADESWVHTTPQPGDFPFVTDQTAAAIVYANDDYRVVTIAVRDLISDIARVTDTRSAPPPNQSRTAGATVFIGTLDKSPAVDAIVRAGKLDVSQLRGAWESFLIATVADPVPGVRQGLVIVGSDRRGTAFGVYELSQAIGVSPWRWWADVPPERKPALYIASGTRRFGPPSVKYRGVFLNDEDWGLQPWAAKTFEPDNGNIGPKTYAKLFELMLRLKANTVWPAMHPGTKPFNDFPENKRLADDYAIVMGSSHAEPMLRNNVGEWKDAHEKYNYVTNREGVRAYWEERVKENGQYENIYTLGMRGIHDSGIQGAKTDAQRVQILEQVIADQREMLAKYAKAYEIPSARRAPRSRGDSQAADSKIPSREGWREAPGCVPQIFCAYKEVLGLYRQGLKVPDDVTIVWPDDNFGYIRNYATAEERKRSGGFGIYYHLSYLGAPMAYLWLYTTPPALVWEEMTKAYDYGARTLWIANVGDLKPAEIGTEFFLQLAWDVNRWDRATLPDFLRTWATREFGAEHADEIAAIMREYYELNYQRKPEHLQWWLPKEKPRPSPLSRPEIAQRLARFEAIRSRADDVLRTLPENRRDAFFELVAYPVRGAALANERYFFGELAALSPVVSSERETFADRAKTADFALVEQTRIYNEDIAGGKWRRMIYLEPADDQWKSFRISKWSIPTFESASAAQATGDAPAADGSEVGRVVPNAPAAAVENESRPVKDDATNPNCLAFEAEHFASKRAGAHATWEIIPGLGRTGDSIALYPTTTDPIDVAQAATEAPRVDYTGDFDAAGTHAATFYLIPTQPIVAGRGLRFAVALDDEAPRPVVVNVRDGSSEWAQGVMNSTILGSTELKIATAGRHTLHVYGTDPGVVLDKIVIDLGAVPATYLGPPETPAK